MLFKDTGDGLTRRFNTDGQTGRLMDVFFAVMNRLVGQPRPQLPAIALKDTNPADNIVQELIA